MVTSGPDGVTHTHTHTHTIKQHCRPVYFGSVDLRAGKTR